MATNANNGHRLGMIRDRVQVKGPNGQWQKIDTRTNQVMSTKGDDKPYKNVRKMN